VGVLGVAKLAAGRITATGVVMSGEMRVHI